jgi:hypothetical protein
MKRSRKSTKESQTSFDEFFNAFVTCSETTDALTKGILSTGIPKKTTISSLRRRPGSLSSKPKQFSASQRSSSPTEAVAAREDNSETLTQHKKSPRTSKIPSPFQELLELQLPDGRWPSLEDVFFCLNLPLGTGIETGLGLGIGLGQQQQKLNLEIWEEATIFALASIRQRYDLFYCLGDAHDKAMTWISNLNASKNLIRQATEILVQLSTAASTAAAATAAAEESKSRPNSPTIRATPAQKKKNKQLTFDIPIDPYRKLLEQSSRHSFSRSYSAMLSLDQDPSSTSASGGSSSKTSEELLAARVEEERKKLALSLMNPLVNYSLFLSEILATKQQFQTTEVSPLLSTTMPHL